MKKWKFTALMLAAIAAVALGGTYALGGTELSQRSTGSDPGVNVVASFYPMYIAALNITEGVEGVTLTNLSEPLTGCLHDYELTSGDMKKLDQADALIVNGGGLEPFLDDIKNLEGDIAIIDSSVNITPIGDNSHFWMSPARYDIQVGNIAGGLKELVHDEEQRARIDANLKKYRDRIEGLTEEEKGLVKPGAKVVLFHEAYEYTVSDLGMEEVFLLDLDEERQVSAAEMRSVMDALNSSSPGLILAEEQYGKRTAEAACRETGASVVYLDTITRGEQGESYAADAYERRMAENFRRLREIK